MNIDPELLVEDSEKKAKISELKNQIQKIEESISVCESNRVKSKDAKSKGMNRDQRQEFNRAISTKILELETERNLIIEEIKALDPKPAFEPKQEPVLDTNEGNEFIKKISIESKSINELLKRLKGFNKKFGDNVLFDDIGLIDHLEYDNKWEDIENNINENFSNNEPDLKTRVIELVKEDHIKWLKKNKNADTSKNKPILPLPAIDNPKKRDEVFKGTFEEFIVSLGGDNSYTAQIREIWDNPKDWEEKIQHISVPEDRAILEDLLKKEGKDKPAPKRKTKPKAQKNNVVQGDEVEFPKKLEDLNVAQTSDEILVLSGVTPPPVPPVPLATPPTPASGPTLVSPPPPPATPPATPTQPVPTVTNFDNLNLEKEQLERGLSKFKPTDEQYKLIQSRIDDIDKTIAGSDDVYGKNKKAVDVDPTKDKEVWAQEKQEAVAQLNRTRDVYMYQMKAEKASEAKDSWFTKLRKMPAKILEEMNWKKSPESTEYIRLRGEYDTAKKRYGNAIGNQEWITKRNSLGDIPVYVETSNKHKAKSDYYETDKITGVRNLVSAGTKVTKMEMNPAYELAQAEISQKLLEEVAIKEFRLLKNAEIEGMPPREKSMVFKALESYSNSKLSREKKMLISASICTGLATATGIVAVPAAAMMFISRLSYGLIVGTTAATVGSLQKKALGGIANISRRKKMKDLNENFSVISGINDYEKLEQAFEKREFRHKVLGIMTSGAIAVGGGIAMRSAFAEAGLLGNTGVAKPSMNQALTPPPVPTEAPIEAVAPDSSSIMEDYIKSKGVPEAAPATPVVTIPSKISVGEQLNPPVPEQELPKISVKTFEDNINDRENGIRLRKGDSAELSAKRIFQNNAKELGYDNKTSGMSERKWAEAQVEKLVKDHPEVRNTITHDGNKIKIEFKEDGSVNKVVIEKDSGYTPKASNITNRVVHNENSGNVPGSKSAASPDVIAQAVGKELPNRVAEIFPAKPSFLGKVSPLNDNRWIAMSNVKADALLKNPLTDVRDFIRVNDLPSDITVGQIKAIKEMVKMGGEYKVLKPGMTVADAVKAVIANQEVGRITRAAGARK